MNKIGNYQILEIVHRGPQPLYKASDQTGKTVALKVTSAASLSEESRQRFIREGETCRKLDHANLVRVFDVGEADGMLYQAMELLEGADLGKVMTESRAFTWDQKLAIMEQVCDGLEFAHANRLVHRDIKPANLFLENSGRVRVLDFGMVRVAESQLTKVGSSLGTLNYMAPEQIRGERCTAATDVFSAGIVFFQFASGRHPFSAKDRSLPQVVSAIVFEQPPKLSDLAPTAPEGLEFLLHRALEKEPSKRLQNAGELKGAIALCRMTLAMGPERRGPGVGGRGPDGSLDRQGASTASPSIGDAETTRVMMRAVAAPSPADAEKTRVMTRPSPAPVAFGSPPAPGPRPPAPAFQPPAPVPAGPAQIFRYCPSCTFANPADAAVCLKCRTPLAAEAAPAKSSNAALYVAIGVAVLLAIALVVVLMTK
jgi:serine/threonine-protein kinase